MWIVETVGNSFFYHLCSLLIDKSSEIITENRFEQFLITSVHLKLTLDFSSSPTEITPSQTSPTTYECVDRMLDSSGTLWNNSSHHLFSYSVKGAKNHSYDHCEARWKFWESFEIFLSFWHKIWSISCWGLAIWPTSSETRSSYVSNMVEDILSNEFYTEASFTPSLCEFTRYSIIWGSIRAIFCCNWVIGRM